MQINVTDSEIDEQVHKLRAGDQRAIAKLMTYAEMNLFLASQVIKKLYKYTGNAYIIGITGAPGVGKSSLVNQMAAFYISEGHRVGIIAVDPTSPFSGGAILGDRIRMKKSFSLKDVFIRSMANRGQMGGLARATRDMIKILDAAGYEIILVETVGVGQDEIDIFKAAHTCVVIVVPGMGDEIQAIKAGIMEITDVFVVNKMDLSGVDRTIMDLETTLQLTHNSKPKKPITPAQGLFVKVNNWKPPIIKTNAITGENIPKFIQNIQTHQDFLKKNDLLPIKKLAACKNEIMDIMKFQLYKKVEDYVFKNTDVNDLIEGIIEGDIDPYSISEDILAKFVKEARILDK
ncbi:MAG: methylmalonyl Co-A mutase-associated GTPase MeaB [Candidatus Lokiarchaeota archaeon]|nr:methylmalonyl Co-A mutase-associated GTPase MeaB [Candidatus Lokiarchaeota archaeon]